MQLIRYLLPLSIALLCSHCQTTYEVENTNKVALISQELLNQLDAQRITLPNGWSLTPVGKSVPLGDFPMNMTVSHDQTRLAITNNGQNTQHIMLYDLLEQRLLDSVVINRAWLGLRFAPDDQSLYVSGGNDNMVKQYAIEDDHLRLRDSIVLGAPWPNPISVAGLDLSGQSHELYTVTKDDSALYVADTESRQVKGRYPLEHEAYTCLYDSTRQRLYISLWGGGQVAVFDTQQKTFLPPITVETHPNDMAMTQDAHYLFVANANANSVSVIDLDQSRVIETISTALYPDAPIGSTTNSVALSPDEKYLYIANADNNCLSLFDVSEPGNSESVGFIPTGWYPTCVRAVGDQLYVANGKGFSSQANPRGPNPYEERTEDTQYIARLLKGTLSVIEAPEAPQLAAYSEAVYRNTPYTKELEMQAEGEPNNPIPQKVGDASPIRYVFYIVKENRTYDQVLGDMPEGNGDSTLCLFPERVSPNHHQLAREFVLLDNFYVDAEVSADGHNWSMGAYATDFVEKTWPTSYGGRGGSYDYEGSRPIAYPDQGYIWDHCQRAGVSYRTYGEFVWEGETKEPALVGHYDRSYPSYNLKVKDVDRFEEWRHDFDSLLAQDAVPQFQTLRLGNDHTAGARLGMPTPRAMVADNDLALGKIIEHLSNSKIWATSVVFVVEDDAQNGPDHVDAHRSLLLIASPYAKRNAVIHSMYSTSSVLRTIELILGIPPMSQYDAAAPSLWKCFTAAPDTSAYTAQPNRIDLNELNTERNKLSDRSAHYPLDQEDAIPDDEFSEVIWKTVRGLGSKMPAPRRSAFLRLAEGEEDEEGKSE